jgi:hypothetical protein
LAPSYFQKGFSWTTSLTLTSHLMSKPMSR